MTSSVLREGGSGRPPAGEVKTLYAQFTAKPGHAARVAELVRELTALVRAEPGNLVFDPYTEESRPERYFVFEVYRDEAAFQAHSTADYGARFNAALADLVEGGASALTWLQPVLPQPGP